MDRCPWAGDDPLMISYHDEEWGSPQRDDRVLFEFLILEGAQAGLSWATILRKRDAYRELYAGFDVGEVARFTDADAVRLLADPRIVRNRLKVRGAIRNARAVLKLVDEKGPLSGFLWNFVGGKPVVNGWRTMAEVPAQTDASRAMSRELLRRGFTFVGPTICYAFMQAVGMVNDHIVSCFRHPTSS